MTLRLIALILSLLAASPVLAAGFQQTLVTAGDPIELAIWYPSHDRTTAQPFGLFQQTVAQNGAPAGDRLPLIIFSHGTGGSSSNSYDTAIALADAGFVVAALTHPGDNYRDHSASFSRANFAHRPLQIRQVIDFMLSGWSNHAVIDPDKIGIFGHSAGGATALITLGATLDWPAVIAFCEATPEDWGCKSAREHPAAAEDGGETGPISAADPRIKAAVLAAPALAEGFSRAGLAGLTTPVQLWVAAKDEILGDAGAIGRNLGHPPETHLVPGAGHFAFLAPCSASLAAIAPQICTDTAGFDRQAFLQTFQGKVIAFFKATLARR